MRLLYNPFKKKKSNGLWKRLNLLGNFTWANKRAILAIQSTIDEMQLNQDYHAEQISDFGDWKTEMLKPKKRGRPRKRV
tara:strand:- start:477 stop:713 length:237 start_codon:yes stop_codon:yes gene_type:complete